MSRLRYRANCARKRALRTARMNNYKWVVRRVLSETPDKRELAHNKIRDLFAETLRTK